MEPEDPRARRERLETMRAAMSAAQDRALLTLSSGAFSLSILFYEKIAPEMAPGTRGLLILAWAAFAASILAVVASFPISEKAHRSELDEMDRQVGALPESGATLDLRWERRLERMNWASAALFGTGVVALLLFGSINLCRAGG